MAWDDSKDTFRTRPSVPVDEKLTSDEWNDHVSDQKSHSGRHEDGGVDEISVQGLSGVLADPQPPNEEQVEDIVNGLLVGGDKITTSYDDGTDTLTIDTSALDTEEVEDAVDALLVGGTNTSLAYDDGAGTLTINVDAPTEAEFNTHATRHEDGGADELNVGGLSGVLADAQTPQTEAVQDIVGGLIQANGNISVTYDDANDTLTVDTSALNEEEVEDAVAALVTAGNAITVNYDDANDSLSIAVDEASLSFYDGTNLTANVDNQLVDTDEINGVTHITSGESIQSALDQLGEGGTVIVHEGVYNETLSPYTDQTIRGVNRDNVIIDGGSQTTIDTPGATNATFENMTVKNDGSTTVILLDSTNNRLENVKVPDSGVDGNDSVIINDSECQVHECILRDSRTDLTRSIDLTPNANNCTVIGCEIALAISDRGSNNNATNTNNVIV